MSFNFKAISENDQINNPVLNFIRKIENNDCQLLISLLDDYKNLDVNSLNAEKAACSVVAAILLQRRAYFCFTYRALNKLVQNDTNLPENIRKGFSARDLNLILAKLINTYKIFELVKTGNEQTRSASIYKVSHPEILSYLESIIDSQSQLDQCINFNNRL